MASQVLNDCAIPPPYGCYCTLITRRCLYVDVVNATWYPLMQVWRPLLGNELFDKSDEFEKPNFVFCFGVGDVGPLNSDTVFAFVKGKNHRNAKRHNNIADTWHLRAVCADKSTPMVPFVRMVESSIMSFCFLEIGPVNS